MTDSIVRWMPGAYAIAALPTRRCKLAKRTPAPHRPLGAIARDPCAGRVQALPHCATRRRNRHVTSTPRTAASATRPRMTVIDGGGQSDTRGAVARDVVVIGGSAGGLEPLKRLVRGIPARTRTAVFVVLHGSPDTPSFLPAILRRTGPFDADFATDGEAMAFRRIYVAPQDHHMLLIDGRIRLTRGPRENGFRPAVDPLFRTASRSFGERVIGVIISGGLDDGAYGL